MWRALKQYALLKNVYRATKHSRPITSRSLLLIMMKQSNLLSVDADFSALPGIMVCINSLATKYSVKDEVENAVDIFSKIKILYDVIKFVKMLPEITFNIGDPVVANRIIEHFYDHTEDLDD